jgi:hypothetical protein
MKAGGKFHALCSNSTSQLKQTKSDTCLSVLFSPKFLLSVKEFCCTHTRNNGLHLIYVPFFFLNSLSGGWISNGVHSARGPLLAYYTCPGWLWGWRIWWNEYWQRKLKYSEKTCPRATLSTTNPTWPDTDANPGRRGGKPTAWTMTRTYSRLLIFCVVLLSPST